MGLLEWDSVGMTLVVALLGSGLATFVSVLLILALRLWLPQRFVFLELLTYFPLLLPPTILGLVLLFVCSTPALEFLSLRIFLFSPQGLVLAGMLTGMPYALQVLLSQAKKLPVTLFWVSQTLGRSKMEFVWLVYFPLLRTAIFQGLRFSIGHVLGEFGVTLIIGGNIPGRTRTLSLVIYESVMQGEMDKAIMNASALIILVLFLFGGIWRLESYFSPTKWDKRA
jgi:molybdate transport system permease protein